MAKFWSLLIFFGVFVCYTPSLAETMTIEPVGLVTVEGAPLPQMLTDAGFGEVVFPETFLSYYRVQANASGNKFMELVSFGPLFTTSNAEHALRMMQGFHPADITECLAYAQQLNRDAIETHLPILTNGPIVCLGNASTRDPYQPIALGDAPNQLILWGGAAGWMLLLGPWTATFKTPDQGSAYKFLLVRDF